MQKRAELKISKLTPKIIEKMKYNTKMFDRMAEDNKAYLYSIAQKFSPQGHHTLDDYVQIARIALWNAVNKFDSQRSDASSFSTFAWKVIYNDILQEVKKINKRGSAEISMESFVRKFENDSSSEYAESFFKGRSIEQCKTFEDDLVQKFTIDDFVKDMDQLHQSIFKCRFIKKMKHKEIAEELNLKFSTYKTIFYKRVKPQIDTLADKLK